MCEHSILEREREGRRRVNYFAPETDSEPRQQVFNRAQSINDTWAKVQAQSATSAHG
jgi:hypothetical protein